MVVREFPLVATGGCRLHSKHLTATRSSVVAITLSTDSDCRVANNCAGVHATRDAQGLITISS